MPAGKLASTLLLPRQWHSAASCARWIDVIVRCASACWTTRSRVKTPAKAAQQLALSCLGLDRQSAGLGEAISWTRTGEPTSTGLCRDVREMAILVRRAHARMRRGSPRNYRITATCSQVTQVGSVTMTFSGVCNRLPASPRLARSCTDNGLVRSCGYTRLGGERWNNARRRWRGESGGGGAW